MPPPHAHPSERVLLCAVDRSEQAKALAELGRQLADRLGLRLRLLHFVPANFGGPSHSIAEGKAFLDELDPDHRAERVVERGNPASGIGLWSGAGTELAIVGSRGRGPVHAAVLGSVSSKLVSESLCPVVVVPPDAKVTLPASPTLVCGIDGSPESIGALQLAAHLATEIEGRVVAVHARPLPLPPSAAIGAEAGGWVAPPEPPEAQDVLADALAAIDTAAPVAIRGETADPIELLTLVAREQDAAMIVLGQRGLGRITRVLAGSVSAELTAKSPVPVLVAPNPSVHTSMGDSAPEAGRDLVDETGRGSFPASDPPSWWSGAKRDQQHA